MLAWWVWSLNGIGLLASFIGSVIIFVRGPKALVGIGHLRMGKEEDLRKSNDPEVQADIRKLDHDRALLKCGFWLMAAGFLFQVIGWGLNTPTK